MGEGIDWDKYNEDITSCKGCGCVVGSDEVWGDKCIHCKDKKISLPWMNRIRARLSEIENDDERWQVCYDFIEPVFSYGLKEEEKITKALEVTNDELDGILNWGKESERTQGE